MDAQIKRWWGGFAIVVALCAVPVLLVLWADTPERNRRDATSAGVSALQVEHRALVQIAQDGEPIVRGDPALQIVGIDEDDEDRPCLV